MVITQHKHLNSIDNKNRARHAKHRKKNNQQNNNQKNIKSKK